MTDLVVPADPPRRTRTSGRWLVRISVVVVVAVLAVVALADLIAPHSATTQRLDQTLLGPSTTHLLGTDDLGRDVFSRMIIGTRTSVLAAGTAVIVAVGIGLPLGVLTGYVGGAVDAVLMRGVDALMSFPAIVLAVGITATLGPGITTAMIAVGVVLAPTVLRLARAQTMSVRTETYIEAARSFGAGGVRRMILPHVLPNVIAPVLVQVAILMGFALIAEASLSFLQLGVQPPNPSWGTVLARSYTFMDQAPLQILVPGLAIAATVFALNILGDEVQRVLDPRRRR